MALVHVVEDRLYAFFLVVSQNYSFFLRSWGRSRGFKADMLLWQRVGYQARSQRYARPE